MPYHAGFMRMVGTARRSGPKQSILPFSIGGDSNDEWSAFNTSSPWSYDHACNVRLVSAEPLGDGGSGSKPDASEISYLKATKFLFCF